MLAGSCCAASPAVGARIYRDLLSRGSKALAWIGAYLLSSPDRPDGLCQDSTVSSENAGIVS